MSKDFELLQRLEREWGRPSVFPEIGAQSAPADPLKGVFKVGKPQSSTVTRPAGQLTSATRAELNKLIALTFLATSAVSTIMITGVEANHSAKWLAACTADLLATTTRARVCLIDFDLDSPAMHQAFSVPNQNGLAAILSGACSIESAVIGIADNLWLIPAGTKIVGREAEPESIRNLLSDVLQECEYLVVSSADYASPKGMVVGAIAEGAVLVMDSATTRRSSAQRAKALLEAAQVRVIGSVLANWRYPIPDFLYERM